MYFFVRVWRNELFGSVLLWVNVSNTANEQYYYYSTDARCSLPPLLPPSPEKKEKRNLCSRLLFNTNHKWCMLVQKNEFYENHKLKIPNQLLLYVVRKRYFSISLIFNWEKGRAQFWTKNKNKYRNYFLTSYCMSFALWTLNWE